MIMRLFLLSFVLVASIFCEEKIQVLVTLVPYQFVVEEIGKEAVEVSVLVPPGVSGHTFEPSPKEMIRVSSAAIWFRMGETFEEKLLPVLKNHNPNIVIVDLRDGIPLIYDEGGCPHCKGAHSEDLHYWLSPHILAIQGKRIEAELKKLSPSSSFALQAFLDRAAAVETEVKKLTVDASPRTIIVSHPAYAYFCRDFGFRQLSIEVEGKDPTPKQLVKLVEEARRLRISKIFAQPQYSVKGATLIAKDLGGTVVMLDPYAKDVFSCLILIAKEFSN